MYMWPFPTHERRETLPGFLIRTARPKLLACRRLGFLFFFFLNAGSLGSLSVHWRLVSLSLVLHHPRPVFIPAWEWVYVFLAAVYNYEGL